MRKTKQTRKPRKASKKTRKTRAAREITDKLFQGHPMAPVNAVDAGVALHLSTYDAERFRDEFADLLCWWRGFRVGFKAMASDTTDLDYAESGIRAMRNMRDALERSIDIAKRTPPF